jgi:hypothetical protein
MSAPAEIQWPDRLSDWTLPPPSARAAGEVERVRMFESAEAAFLLTPCAMSNLEAKDRRAFGGRKVPNRGGESGFNGLLGRKPKFL